MPCPHYSIKISTRSKSPPTTAQAAYQSGERLYDERTHRTKNYTEKRGIVYTEILLPDNAPREYADRNTLWNAVEKSETNWNAQMARRFEIALPKELPMQTRIELIREYCLEQFVARGMIADVAVHDPDPPGHNPHAHVMLTMRAMDEQGRWLPKSRREYELDENGNRIRDANGKWIFRKVFTNDWSDRGNAEKWRQAWEDIQNRYLQEAQQPERVSMKSYERQGVDQIPTVHMGPAVSAMERKGIQTNIGNLNREIKKTNRLIAAIKRAIARIRDWLTEIKEGIVEIEMKPREILLVDLLIQRFDERKAVRRETWDSIFGQQKADIIDLKRFAAITAYMRENGIRTVEDLDARADAISEAGLPARRKLNEVRERIHNVRALLETGRIRDKYAPVHDQYLSIHWRGRKEKFAKEHKDELEKWNKADRFIRANLPDKPFKAAALEEELSSLSKRLDELNAELAPGKEETAMLDDIRYLVKDLLPELEPEGDRMTQESKTTRQMSIRERLAAAKIEADRQNAERRQRPQRKNEDRDAR